MANKPKTLDCPTLEELFEHFPEFMTALIEEPDVVVALIVGSYLDSALIRLLESHLACKKNAVFLLESDGPLGNSYRRAVAAYCLGMITSGEMDVIQKVSSIRNEFAHGWKTKATFDNANIAEKCLTLVYPEPWISLPCNLRREAPSKENLSNNPRGRFVQIGFAITQSILNADNRVPPATPFAW